MATVLFIGGVGPDVTQEDLISAFSQHANLLASSVVRNPASGKCVGQAYVTVAAEDVDRATTVIEVGGNSVCVFPVDVEAWVAPVAVQGPAPAPNHGSRPPQGAPAAAAAWGGYSGGGGGPSLAAAPASAGENLGPLPTTTHVHLQGALDQLRSNLLAHPRLAFNGKPFYMLLHETCQKRQMALQVLEGPDGAAFSCTINACSGSSVICTGRAAGGSKKDAKHNAAAACLDRLLAMGQVTPNELAAAMTFQAQNSAGIGGLGGDPFAGGSAGGGSGSTNPAAATAMAQTQNIMRLGLYPRCEEVMRMVHSTESGRVKTILMVLNEYGVRARFAVQHEELPSPAASSLAGPFKFLTRLTDVSGLVVAQATGVELRSKQEAKQAAAAAVIEYVVAHNVASVDSVARGK